jgi:hypothetical protein
MYGMDSQTPVIVVSHINDENKFTIYEFGTSQQASGFCKMINTLCPKDDGWIYAKEITLGVEYNLENFIRMNFRILADLDDLAVQKILQVTSNEQIAKALKSADKDVQEKVLKNMSSRAQILLKEDMEYMGPVRLKDAEEAQEYMLNIVKHLRETGHIVLPKSS